MSNNLFSVFEPSALGGLSLNWVSLAVILAIPTSLSLTWGYGTSLASAVSRSLNQASRETFGAAVSPVSGLVGVALLIVIALNNFAGLGPYYFTASAHLVFGFALALSMWLGYMGVYFVYFNEEFMSHLIPGGTPASLVLLMVLIESVSSIIRPLTLMFRLTANMIAGHLLVTLLSGSLVNSGWLTALAASGALVILLVLESAVALIQSYVFYLLSSLYLTDLLGSGNSVEHVSKSQSY